MTALQRPDLRRLFSQRRLLFGGTAALIAALVIGPLVLLVITSFRPENPITGETGGFGFGNFGTALGASDTARLILNTLYFACGSVALGLVVASAVAWFTERTDLPGRRTVRTLMFVSMAVPPLMSAFGWILLLNPNNGMINVWLRDTPFHLSIYNLPMMIVVSGLNFTPTMFVMLTGVLHNMDVRLESAGSVSGVSRSRVLRKITLPLLRPGMLSVVVYLFMIAIQVIEVPLAIGLTAGVPLLSTRIFLLASPQSAVPLYGVAAAFGVVLLVAAVALLLGYYRVTRRSERYQVVTGKGYRPHRSTLGRWRPAAVAFVCGYFALMLAPVLALLWTSLLPVYQVPSAHALGSIGLQNFSGILQDSLVREAISNTVELVLVTATLTMVLATLVSWFSARGKIRGGKLVEVLAFSPLAIPQIVLATALLVLSSPTVFFGSIWVVIFGLTIIYLPFGVRTMSSVFMQLNEELEQAGTVSGAPFLRTFRRILLPLIRPQLVDGWLWVAAHSLRDLTIPLTLLTGSNIVVSSALWQIWNYPEIERASALGILMILGSLVLVVPAQLQLHRSESRQGRAKRVRAPKLELTGA